MTHALITAATMIALAIGPLTLLSGPAPDDGVVLVVVPPWRDSAAILAAAGMRPVGPVQAPFAVLAAGAPGSAKALTGVWAVIGAGRIAAICGVRTNG
ncbi:hypothetical protein ATO6_11010 [Oceanicola sp. 22II-s10i]|uniref:hypothetical protein n=1 Tax=Oceanicola sp. 22II-s10i TaxID=1317116 RepID=UPI000B522855|nr:hypothetical protein [Oceanicola sp. 22II-s10i]OWU84835.1 hypothetical protein ATO6_11010 [Oceanicola sp. 22II-s10i]